MIPIGFCKAGDLCDILSVQIIPSVNLKVRFLITNANKTLVSQAERAAN